MYSTLNLRPCGATLTPVCPPNQVAQGTWRALSTITEPESGSPLLLVAAGCSLATVSTSQPAEPTVIATLPAPVQCATALGQNMLVVTSQGTHSFFFHKESNAWLDSDPRLWPALSLIAAEGANAQGAVPAMQLSHAYASYEHSLRPTDIRSLTYALRAAYSSLAASAAAQGAFCAPAIVRYRLIGHRSQVLFTSPPLLLGSSSPSALAAPIELSSTDRQSLPAFSLSARTWRVRLCASAPIPPAMAAMVSRIEILASPQLHPFNPSAVASANVVASPSSSAFVRFSLPGAELALAPVNASAASRRLSALVASLSEHEQVVATIQGPFTQGSEPDVIPALALSPALKGNPFLCDLPMPLPSESPLQQITPPHSFSASCIAASGPNILYGSLTAHRFCGYPLSAFAAGVGGATPWHAAVSVRFASGSEQVVALSQGTSHPPLSLNPLLSYPSPHAVSMTLIVTHGGETHRSTVPLTPCGSMAVCVNTSFAPVPFAAQASAFATPPESPVPRPLPSFVAVAPALNPLAPASVVPLGQGSVMSLHPASRSLSSWDFSSSRFSALTTTGTFTLSFPSASPWRGIAASCIDTRPVVSPHAAVAASGRLFAIAASSLVEVGVSRLKTLIHNLPAQCLAFNPTHRELWASSPTQTTSRIIPLDHLSSPSKISSAPIHIRSGTLSSSSIHSPLGAFATLGGSLCNLAHELPPETVTVAFKKQFTFSQTSYSRPTHLFIDIRSPLVTSASLHLHRLSHTETEPAPFFRASLSGPILAPIRLSVASPPLRAATLSLHATLHPSSTISPPQFSN